MAPLKPDAGDGPQARSLLVELGSLGLNLGAGLALFTLLGAAIDRKRGGGGVAFTVGGMLVGVAYGVYEIWRVVRAANAADRPVSRNQNATPKEPDK